MKLTIRRFKTKDITTSRGAATLLTFESGGEWYSSFAASWNNHWQEGTVIDIDPAQIKEKEKNGKLYLNIAAPTKAQGQSGPGSDRVIRALETIWKDLQLIKRNLGIEQE
jgi:hypothetical protein